MFHFVMMQSVVQALKSLFNVTDKATGAKMLEDSSLEGR